MKILALEFSSDQRSAAVLDASVGLTFEAKTSQPGGTKAFALIEDALNQAGSNRKQIDCIAVGLGPGSYAGIRIAIAIAQGWQLACGTNLLGISSVESIAFETQKAKMHGKVTISIDAQRGEFYVATYMISPHERSEISSLRIAGAEEISARAKQSDVMIGPGGRQLFPTASALGFLASSRKDFISGDRLEPIYLRETTFVKAPPARTIT